MNYLKKTQTNIFNDKDKEMNIMNIDNLKVGKKDLTNIVKKSQPVSMIEMRTKYEIDQTIFDDEYDALDEKEIFIPIQYKYNSYIQGYISNIKNIKQNEIKDKLNDICLSRIDESDEDKEDEELNINEEKEENMEEELEEKKKKIEIKNIPRENVDIFGEEKCPPDDGPIGKPPDEKIELSDIELDGEDELEELEINNSNNNNKNQILFAMNPQLEIIYNFLNIL